MENEASASPLVLAATVMADGARAGDTLQASAELLPAATATLMPSDVMRAMALSSAVLAPPPRLRLATAGWPAWCWATTQSMAEMMPEVEPLPLQFNTRTAKRLGGTDVKVMAGTCDPGDVGDGLTLADPALRGRRRRGP